MKFKLIFACILFFCAGTLKAQTAKEKQFATFAQRQDSLFNQAYQKRDAKTYEKLLAASLKEYNNLSDSVKKDFSGYYMNSFYNLCCTYSLLNKKQQALDYLEKTIKEGYYDYAHIQADADLDNIRNEARFKTLVLSTREIGDYMYILNKGGKYNLSDKREIPKFTYQSADNPHLVSLRKAFKLDSVAGTGNDASKIINLLHWVHNIIPHDGGHGNPEVMNAMNMIAVCKKDNRGLNCRGLATVLNECYLSLGIKSRLVTCLPKDSLGIDLDCHVINTVYVNSLKKWIWIDPTNDAYVMNEKGDLLGIEEVRERLVNGKQLIINPDANWNHKQSVVIENYLYYYMAKNLYMLECPLNSEYDLETKVKDKKLAYVTLLPLDYFKQSPDKSEHTNALNGAIFTYYKTNNPTNFWQVPAAESIAKTK
ncbi:Transglutaminase-like superfamily protein [Mucilaginibacter pineti]|uniref:Transglutaminase-like superfamily protein n=1 Tax=Mucilaginibacter pineti TaxID=1391627 RepID=A0A1G7AMI4_9SPHI|nr:transglutaminase-like domain-containing protein [Mucilaginibacter pineti]SDE15225.1 Transglutaminase-like superfamily protein [Mucilaginibacter pineti]